MNPKKINPLIGGGGGGLATRGDHAPIDQSDLRAAEALDRGLRR